MDKRDDFIVCRCENVYYSDLLLMMDEGVSNSRELKLKSRAGMGFCASRTCGHFLDQLTNDKSAGTPAYVSLKSQPPIRTVSFGDLFKGGRP